jgi:hypothetical protein
VKELCVVVVTDKHLAPMGTLTHLPLWQFFLTPNPPEKQPIIVDVLYQISTIPVKEIHD